MTTTWRPWSGGGGAAALAMAALATGCFMGSSSSSSGGGGGYGSAGSGSGGSSGGASQPMLVVVDTGQTLTASGGQGVGVFTEYQQGGHWHVWWTCDTSMTQLGCQFRVDVTAGTGAITNIAGHLASAGAQFTQPGPSEVLATSTTTLAVDGLVFDTTPGTTITLDAQVDGAQNGAFLFFVQDGQVNGGYKGSISDPLMLQPSAG